MNIGVVVIGRNEGQRLRRCLESLKQAAGQVGPIVYVDSGSTDGSVELARGLGALVVELDMTRPFSAARARNAGFRQLMSTAPQTSLVQFVDGDCEVEGGFFDAAVALLQQKPEAAVVAGQVIEKHPEASCYNLLCSLEWQKPAGPIDACGGIFLIRSEAYRLVGGMREDVIAAEDDELCLRLRRGGGQIWSIDHPMVRHDAAMTHFRQWWKRSTRMGHAYAQGCSLHGSSEEGHFVRQCRGLWLWGLVFPLAALLLAWPTRGVSLAALAGLYALQGWRVYRKGRQRGWSRRQARVYAFFTIIAKFPGVWGMIKFHRRRLGGEALTLIEYKQAGSTA